MKRSLKSVKRVTKKKPKKKEINLDKMIAVSMKPKNKDLKSKAVPTNKIMNLKKPPMKTKDKNVKLKNNG